MRDFLDSKILFPKQLGFAPYFWLLWFLPAIVYVLQFPNYLKWTLLLTLLVFLKIYRDSFFLINKKFDYNVLAQLILCIIFGSIAKYPFLFIYTGYIIGEQYFNTKNIRFLLVTYYVFSLYCIIYIIYVAKLNNLNDLLSFIFGFVFILGCVPASYSKMKHSQLLQKNKRLELLIRHNERDRIAQQLHDNLGQSFSILALKAELSSKLLDKDKLELAKQQLDDIAEISRNDLNLVRKIVTDLKSDTIIQTLNKQYQYLEDAKIMLFTQNEDLTTSWDRTVQNILSQVITESVTNCIKYSNASHIRISFSAKNNSYLVTISDNGIGFDNYLKQDHESFGISGIKRNIANLDGSVEFKSDNGANIFISIPIPKKEDNNHD